MNTLTRSKTACCLLAACYIAFVGACLSIDRASADTPALNKDLIGHWKLNTDCKDYSGQGLHGVNHGVNFADGHAKFDGINNFIDIPETDLLNLGKQDFSVSVWVHTAKELTDVLGDIVSKFDPATRTGLNLSIMNYAGVTTSQSNFRHLSFGIDAGHADKEWADCGKPGNAKFIMGMAVCEGNLYVGTFEDGKDEFGHVYRYEGGTKWVDCELPDMTNGIGSLAVYEGKLYVGTTRYNPKGSLMPTAKNITSGGKVYRYDGGTKWTDCGKLGEAYAVGSLIVYDGKLFGSTLYKEGKGLYRYDGESRWTYCGNPGMRTQPLTLFNGNLYAGSPDMGHFLRYDGRKNWTDLGQAAATTSQVYSFIAYQGKLHHGNWPTASVFSYDVASNRWDSVGQLGREQEVMGISVYNGMMYCGTLPLGKVYRFDGPDKWTFVGRVDKTPNVPYRRIWTMAVYQGKLFAGTLPSGHVYSFEAGKCVTPDRELAPGWRHVTAVKSNGTLKLYVDGKCVATSTAFDSEKYDLSNSSPLKIGFGQHDYFNGKMKDLRIYRRSLSDREILDLSNNNG